MQEGWIEDDYLIIFNDAEAAEASARYEIAKALDESIGFSRIPSFSWLIVVDRLRPGFETANTSAAHLLRSAGAPASRRSSEEIGPRNRRDTRKKTAFMKNEAAWLAVFEAVAKLVVAATLFAYLLHRGGLRPKAVAVVILAHLIALFFVLPTSPEFVFAAIIALGTCAYSVLVVDRIAIRAGLVGFCFIAVGALLARDPPGVSIAVLLTLALWAGLWASMRDWAKPRPVSKTETATPTAADDRARGDVTKSQ